MIYAYVNAQGYVQSTQQGGEEQTIEGLTTHVLEAPLPVSPNPSYSYNFNTSQWEDARPEEQKRAEAIAAANKRRSTLLISSDWTQIPNNPLTAEKQAAWATYRQALRDITTQADYPFNIVWPTPPQ